MLTTFGNKLLKKGKRKQYISYDEIKVSTTDTSIKQVEFWSGGKCISIKALDRNFIMGDTISISNLIGELEVTRKVIVEDIKKDVS